MKPCTSNKALAICTAPCNGGGGGNGGAGFTDYAYIYNLGVQTVGKGTAVKFSANEILSGAIAHTAGQDKITISKTGVYYIQYYVYAENQTQFGLYLGASSTPISISTVYAQGGSGSSKPNTPNTGMAIVRLNSTGDLTLKLTDLVGGADTALIDKPLGSTQAVDASIIIIRIAD